VSNRREFTRINLRASLSFELPDATTAVGEVEDLSLSGAWVRSGLQVPLGVHGNFKLFFGDSDPLIVAGLATVVRHGEGGFGITFDGVDLAGYHHLRNLVTYNADDRSDQVQEEIRSHLGLRRR